MKGDSVKWEFSVSPDFRDLSEGGKGFGGLTGFEAVGLTRLLSLANGRSFYLCRDSLALRIIGVDGLEEPVGGSLMKFELSYIAVREDE